MSVLTPDRINKHGTAEGHLWGMGIKPIVENMVAAAIVDGVNLSRENFRERLREGMETCHPFEKTREVEKSQEEVLGTGPYSILYPQDPDPEVQNQFYSKLIDHLCETNAPFFEILNRMREHSAIGPEILGLLKFAQLAISEDPPNFGKIFDFIKSETDSHGFKISHTDPEALYFISYLPFRLRYSIQDFILKKFQIGFLETLSGRYGEECDTAINAMTQHKKSLIFANSHWSFLANQSLAEPYLLKLATAEIERQACVIELQKLAVGPAYQKISQLYEEFWRSATGRIRAFDKSMGSAVLQAQDVGHCFSDLSAVPDARKERQQKSGLRALLLEDDSYQMQTWCTALNTYSRFTVSERDRFERPEGIKHSPDIGLYLLDIQNHENKFAGIQVAARLLLETAQYQKAQLNLGAKLNLVTIRVWSLSSAAVREASEVLEPVVDEIKRIHRYVRGNNSISSDCLLKLEVQTKFDFNSLLSL